MPVRGDEVPGRSWSGGWWSGRALLLHLALVISVPTCGIAAYWQLDRALSGNVLSWAYTFEWPAFAGLAGWVWWAMLHLPAGAGPAGSEAPGPVRLRSPRQARRQRLLEQRRKDPEWDPAGVGPRLRAYNEYLRTLEGATPRQARRLARPPGGGCD